MKMNDLAYDDKGVLHIVRPKGISNYLFYSAHPKIVLTKNEALKWGLDLNNKKGFYITVDDIRVPIEVL